MVSLKKIEAEKMRLRAKLADLMLSVDLSKKTLSKIRDEIVISDDFRTFKRIENEINKLNETKSTSLKEVKEKRKEEIKKEAEEMEN